MDCMQASGCPPRLKAQATRLLRIAVGRVVDPRPFIRYDRGWEDDAGCVWPSPVRYEEVCPGHVREGGEQAIAKCGGQAEKRFVYPKSYFRPLS